ncbi:Transporter, major facilitator family protein (fragment) [Paraburkholderia piptadeniae]|uniref:Transporter, major facilitator family protein n=1 Tax=Paraburkholderia piptadeniae TaxID=1701573 RepID=A0A1N7SGA2_9BURK
MFDHARCARTAFLAGTWRGRIAPHEGIRQRSAPHSSRGRTQGAREGLDARVDYRGRFRIPLDAAWRPLRAGAARHAVTRGSRPRGVPRKPATHRFPFCPSLRRRVSRASRRPLQSNADTISARRDRLPAARTAQKLVILLSLGFFFFDLDLLYSGDVAPGLMKSNILLPSMHGLFGTGATSFSAALFAGLSIGTLACGFLADTFRRRSVFTRSLPWDVCSERRHAGGLNL